MAETWPRQVLLYKINKSTGLSEIDFTVNLLRNKSNSILNRRYQIDCLKADKYLLLLIQRKNKQAINIWQTTKKTLEWVYSKLTINLTHHRTTNINNHSKLSMFPATGRTRKYGYLLLSIIIK